MGADVLSIVLGLVVDGILVVVVVVVVVVLVVVVVGTVGTVGACVVGEGPTKARLHGMTKP